MTKEEYKEKLTWLESTPKTWAVKPLLSVSKERSVKSATGELLSVYLDRGVIRASDGNLGTHAPSDTMDNYQSIEPGDFVLNNQQAWRGSVGVSFEYGIISPAYLVLRLSKELDARYSNYLFRSRPIVDQFMLASQGVGTIQRQIHAPSFKNILTVVPPLETQKSIAAFLDEKTKAIDELVLKKEKLIELLREKRTVVIKQAVTKGLNPHSEFVESDIDWIGKIPKEWKIIKLGHLLAYDQPGDYIPKDIAFLESQGETTPVLTANKGFVIGHTYEKNNIYKKNLPVIIFDDFTTDAKFVDFPFKVRSSALKILRIRNKEENDIRFIFRNMEVLGFHIMDHNRHWISMYSKENIGLPTYKIQQQVADFLDIETAKIDKAAALIESQIKKLKEYRSSLIYSAVTGKIKV